MTIYSMTGSASRTRTVHGNRGDTRITADIRSVNNRFLDLSLRLPDVLRTSESELRRMISNRIKRGKVELRVALVQVEETVAAAPDLTQLQHLRDLENHVLHTIPNARPLGVADILALCANSRGTDSSADLSAPLMMLCDALLTDFLQARAHEGERLRSVIQTRVDALQALIAQARPLVPEAIEAQRSRFLARWQDALDTAGIDTADSPAVQERALAEIASYALRIDVAEELDRSNAHLAEIADVLREGGVSGKRLDFIVQELHREANTLGSKAASLALTHISVNAKVLIEQIREQVQNIE